MTTHSYSIRTTERITVDWFTVIDCPACGIETGICLSTSGDGQPVTGSCPADHVWNEHRVTGSDIKEKAIEMAWESR
jgi:hypothetical protein